MLELSPDERDFLLFRLALGSEQDSNTGCQVWQGGVNSKGYGTISVKGYNLYVHRVQHVLTSGPLPKGEFVCHTCDNRRCLAPAHLFAGTAQMNYDDMREKGNAQAWGHRVPPRALTLKVA